MTTCFDKMLQTGVKWSHPHQNLRQFELFLFSHYIFMYLMRPTRFTLSLDFSLCKFWPDQSDPLNFVIVLVLDLEATGSTVLMDLCQLISKNKQTNKQKHKVDLPIPLAHTIQEVQFNDWWKHLQISNVTSWLKAYIYYYKEMHLIPFILSCALNICTSSLSH